MKIKSYSKGRLQMIIPIKCFTCGNVLADKYLYYQRKCREMKSNEQQKSKVLYLTPERIEKAVEGKVLDHLKLKKMCCRRHMLTHVDIK